jgi:hypothetical protein
MPLHESLPINVTLTVEVDRHILRFDRAGKATGSRYHGEAAPQEYRNSVLEANVRHEVAKLLDQLVDESGELLRRLYPVDADRRAKQ